MGFPFTDTWSLCGSNLSTQVSRFPVNFNKSFVYKYVGFSTAGDSAVGNELIESNGCHGFSLLNHWFELERLISGTFFQRSELSTGGGVGVFLRAFFILLVKR